MTKETFPVLWIDSLKGEHRSPRFVADFSRMGYQIKVVTESGEFWNKMQSPDLKAIIMEIMFSPEGLSLNPLEMAAAMGGYETGLVLVKRLRAQEQSKGYPQKPIIIVTGNPSTNAELKLREMGVQHILGKYDEDRVAKGQLLSALNDISGLQGSFEPNRTNPSDWGIREDTPFAACFYSAFNMVIEEFYGYKGLSKDYYSGRRIDSIPSTISFLNEKLSSS